MSFTIYEGDMQEVQVKNEPNLTFGIGEYHLASVRYLAKRVGVNEWYGILNTGMILPITPKKRHRMMRVGSTCAFHYTISQALYDHLRGRKIPPKEIVQLLDGRKRTIWEKEGRKM